MYGCQGGITHYCSTDNRKIQDKFRKMGKPRTITLVLNYRSVVPFTDVCGIFFIRSTSVDIRQQPLMRQITGPSQHPIIQPPAYPAKNESFLTWGLSAIHKSWFCSEFYLGLISLGTSPRGLVCRRVSSQYPARKLARRKRLRITLSVFPWPFNTSCIPFFSQSTE